MKKVFACVAFCFLVCALFHKQILGTVIRLGLKSQYDCELAYRSLDWEEGELVFTDLVLFDPSFHTHIQRAGIRFDWGAFPKKMKAHLEIDRPFVSISEQREWQKLGEESWLELSASVKNGTLDWEGPVQFSLAHSEEGSELSLEWKDASAFVSVVDGKLEGELNHFRVPLLKQWIPAVDVTDGRLTGRFTVDTEGELLSANLAVDGVNLTLALGEMAGVGGSFSYHTDVGMKWDLQGVGRAEEKQFPFTCQGRGFFKSGWLESKIEFGEAWCQLAKGGGWTFECHDLSSEKFTWLQGGLALWVPEALDWRLEKGTLEGKGFWSGPVWKAQFTAKDLLLHKGTHLFHCTSAQGDLSHEGGEGSILSTDYALQFKGPWKNWSADVRFQDVTLALQGSVEEGRVPIRVKKGNIADIEFSGDGWIDSEFDLAFHLHGMWRFLQKEIPFECPHLSKTGDLWSFDVRVVRNMWDLFRLAGTYDGKEVLYHKRSHLLGAPLQCAATPLGELDITTELSWPSLLSAGPFLQEWNVDLKKLPKIEKTALHLQYKGGLLDLTAEAAAPPFTFHATQSKEGWNFDLQSDLTLQAALQNDGKVKGKGGWKELLSGQFEGKIDPSFHCQLALSNLTADLKLIDALKLEGKVEGQGHFIYNGEIESDFDLRASPLLIESYALENEGEIHLSYTSSNGVLLQGINLHGPFDCKIDLLKYDTSHWILTHAQVHCPGSFLTHRFLRFLDKELDLNFTADLDLASDFSTFVCTMKEGSLPYEGAYHHIQDLALSWGQDRCKASLRYRGYLHRLQLQIDDHISGRLTLGEDPEPLTIDWEYADRLLFHSIEGSFSGVDASFHAESPNQLVGRAHVNFTELSKILPPDVAQVFAEIEMGKGYELKGRLHIENNIPSFKGLLSGKSLELFGFQFRTLLAQVDLSPSAIHIYDVKISDTAGMMVIDQIYLEGNPSQPWTISIPTLTLRELRPSLLLRPGGTVGPIDPLVVRELTMTDFKGLVADGNTYTANGSLHFINSYKREETVFDLPANVFSRIVGLDIDLLIPVTGDVTFDLKDGYFNLLELKNAYSESRRSQFFLEMDPPPRMDLDGNLRIFIKMKQFVLLKITESLLISIDGILDDPQFHLTRKRFFGLM